MSTDWADEAEEVFNRGLELSAQEREAILRGIAPTTAATVRQLWISHDEAPTGFWADRNENETVKSAEPGDLVEGRFRLTAFLGAGGMGEVFRATDEALGRQVAVKFLRSTLGLRPLSRGLIEREARAVCLLNHPNICTLFDLRWHQGTPFLVIEYLAGETLAARIARRPLPLADCLAVAMAIADGLAHAHEQGVIHRDLKPANVMLTPGGPKIFDFGIARRVASLPPGTGSAPTAPTGRAFGGSASYMSPEQAEGLPPDAPSDIFSFGCVLYEMATGQKAFQGRSPLSKIAAVLLSEPRPMRDIVPELPIDLVMLVAKCLAKDPAGRFQTALELQRALDRLIADNQRPRAVAAWTLLPGAGGFAARYRPWLVAAAMLLLAGVLGGPSFQRSFRNTGAAAWIDSGAPPEATDPDRPTTSTGGFNGKPSASASLPTTGVQPPMAGSHSTTAPAAPLALASGKQWSLPAAAAIAVNPDAVPAAPKVDTLNSETDQEPPQVSTTDSSSTSATSSEIERADISSIRPRALTVTLRWPSWAAGSQISIDGHSPVYLDPLDAISARVGFSSTTAVHMVQLRRGEKVVCEKRFSSTASNREQEVFPCLP